MSYYDTGATELIARQGYSGLGVASVTGAPPKWATVPTAVPPPAPKPTAKATAKPAWWESAISSTVDFFAQKEKTKQAQAAQEALRREGLSAQAELQQQAYAAGAAKPTPKWLLPAAIGGGVLVLLLVLKKK
ncbi:MAG: hypothetical protein KJO40_13480 [Deltaproteobacteria bacterium]|nr:hypothetical protein [Deltaproteobacteria bacterium]